MKRNLFTAAGNEPMKPGVRRPAARVAERLSIVASNEGFIQRQGSEQPRLRSVLKRLAQPLRAVSIQSDVHRRRTDPAKTNNEERGNNR